MNEVIDFAGLAETLLRYQSVILPEILPGGKLVGKEWCCGDIRGQSGMSFKFNTENGTFKDFATGEGGKDLIALYAKQNKLQMIDAAKYLREKYLAAEPVIKYNYPVKATKDETTIIKPPIDCENPPIPSNAKSWSYKDENGDTLYYIIRIDNSDGTKFYYPLSFSNKKEWVKKHYPNQIPYNLDLIAKDLSKPILIVEGEKAAEAAASRMNVYIVTTWASGSNNWKKCNWNYLKGRKVLLWPDADRAGKDCMNSLCKYLLEEDIVSEVKLINTDKENGWDAYDAFITDNWNYKKWAEWAKPIVTVHVKTQKVEIITPEEQQEEIDGSKLIDIDISHLISSEDFPVSPNLQMKFMDLGLQFSDTKNTKLVMNASNVAKIIRADFSEIVWRDDFYGKIFTTWKTGKKRQWSDIDTNDLYIEMQHHYELAKISKTHIQEAIEYVAARNRKNEPQEWVKSLKWDGIKRIDDFFHKIMGAEHSEYTSAVSKNFWIGLTARIMDAGCKLDEMVVLEGKQGTYKTTSLEIIGGEWYGEVNSDIMSKDFDQGLKGKIIVEFGELANLKNADIETIKRKLSTRIDEYRPSYGRYVEQHARTCIFVGTTNDDKYLKDRTGNRRFWPMKIEKVDTEYLKENRDQYFAEAYQRYLTGEKWHEVPWQDAERIRFERLEVNDIQERVSVLLNNESHRYFTTADIYEQLVGQSSLKMSKQEKTKITSAMHELGYRQRTTRVGENKTPMSVWRKLNG